MSVGGLGKDMVSERHVGQIEVSWTLVGMQFVRSYQCLAKC